MSNAEDTFSRLYSVARAAARSAITGNHEYVSEEDLSQEGMLWLLEHPRRVDNHTLPSGELHFPGLQAELVGVLHNVVNAERRQVMGFDPQDEYKYSLKLIEVVLPAVFDSSYRPPVVDEVRVTTSNDPATADNWSSFVMDVRRAVNAVASLEDRRVLLTRSVGGWTWAQFGEVYTQSGETFRLRYWDALRRICAFLNGGEVLESTPDGIEAESAVSGAVTAPVARSETDWFVAGRDPYREPDA